MSAVARTQKQTIYDAVKMQPLQSYAYYLQIEKIKSQHNLKKEFSFHLSPCGPFESV